MKNFENDFPQFDEDNTMPADHVADLAKQKEQTAKIFKALSSPFDDLKRESVANLIIKIK
jgi:hypothetical protein